VGGTLEDNAYILDYLPEGLPGERSFKREPIAYALGESEFKLFELVPKPDAIIMIGEKVYIGKDVDKREKIQHVKRRMGYEELTSASHSELPYIIQDLVMDNENRFVQFFNSAQAITTRYHMLELLPGLGKKTMWAILEERKKGNFKSFKDLSDRVPSVKHPEKLVAKRIEIELSDPHQKYHLFVAR
jgi:putative nucleotide binding protein